MLDTATISTLGLLYMYIKSSMTRIRQETSDIIPGAVIEL